MADRDSPFERKIHLAHEPPLHIGAILLCPPTRELIGPDRRAVLEPRVMQVMIALAQTPNEIITRDELIIRCWHGTTVGENAIHRVISRLRQLAEQFGGAFAIDTINKVGYRLRSIETAPSSEQLFQAQQTDPARMAATNERDFLPRRAAVGALLVSGLGLAAIGGFTRPGHSNDRDNEAAADLLAQAVQADRADQPEDDMRAAALLMRATKVAPRRPELWGKLALAQTKIAEHGDPSRAAALVQSTEDAARRAIALDPRQADALGSLAILPPYYGDWLAAERRMNSVLRVDPTHVPTHDALAFMYVAVGRSRAGARDRLAYVTKDPMHIGHLYRLIYAYWILGQIGDVDRTADRALQLSPSHPGVWFSRLWTLAFTGRAERALLHLDDVSRRPDLPPPLIRTLRASMVAMASRRPADVTRAVDLVMAGVAASQSGSVNAIMILCSLGAIDRAFAVAEAYLLERGPLIASVTWRPGEVTVKDQHRRKTNMLFVPVAAPMQADPRFQRLVDDIGLSRYWHESGTQPDFMKGRSVRPGQA